MRSNRLLIIYILLAVFALSACSSDNDTTDGDTSDVYGCFYLEEFTESLN